ncbi:hypothetical protein GBAR_LOCUS5247 [Geodia barretti]|uniref:AB hydrolase-1 domain-containing protein n=1 Tax=Geodia barretti TaxID=519541 RepID=A0AA35RAR9_GEOBA|nr:hypothetical protein GBAR_LOCUS5247 [Geodia barretti]
MSLTCKLSDFILVGHSAGARYAFVFAAEHPDLLRALVVVDIDPDAVNPDSQGMFVRYNTESDEWDSLDAVVERLRDRQPQSTDEMLLHQAKVMTRELADGRRVWKRDRRLLAAYERPDLWGRVGAHNRAHADSARASEQPADARGRRANARGNCWHTPVVRLAELEGGGHWFYQEFPGAFEATVRWFMRAVSQVDIQAATVWESYKRLHCCRFFVFTFLTYEFQFFYLYAAYGQENIKRTFKVIY